LKICRNQTFTIDLGTDRGKCFTSPSSPIPKISLNASEQPSDSFQGIPFQPISSAVSNKSNISHLTGSNSSLPDEIFNFDCSVTNPDGEKQEDTSGEDSETPSIIVNPKLLTYLEEGLNDTDLKKDDTEEYYTESWDNLGTIQELPELGYQSDGSDTDLLIPKSKQKCQHKSISEGPDVILPTVHEDETL
jgi:hypothetical protein